MALLQNFAALTLINQPASALADSLPDVAGAAVQADLDATLDAKLNLDSEPKMPMESYEQEHEHGLGHGHDADLDMDHHHGLDGMDFDGNFDDHEHHYEEGFTITNEEFLEMDGPTFMEAMQKMHPDEFGRILGELDQAHLDELLGSLFGNMDMGDMGMEGMDGFEGDFDGEFGFGGEADEAAHADEVDEEVDEEVPVHKEL